MWQALLIIGGMFLALPILQNMWPEYVGMLLPESTTAFESAFWTYFPYILGASFVIAAVWMFRSGRSKRDGL